jgi:mannosyltransferase OCH1-like enzyme
LEKHSKPAWQSLNPDYKIELFDNAMCEKYLETEFSSYHKSIFQRIPDGPIKADFWRLCVLYKEGGVYADADNVPNIPLDAFLEDVDFVTCSAYWRFKLNPNFIATKPNNPFLFKAIHAYIDMFHLKKPYSYWVWSIMPILSAIVGFEGGDDGIYLLKSQQVQIIKECPGAHHYDAHNVYKGARVFENRNPKWSHETHSFTE